MKLAHIRTTIDRHTGEVISKEIIGYKVVDEYEYFRPLVEIFWKRIQEEMKREGKINGHK